MPKNNQKREAAGGNHSQSTYYTEKGKRVGKNRGSRGPGKKGGWGGQKWRGGDASDALLNRKQQPGPGQQKKAARS